jgi:hypothetical protein
MLSISTAAFSVRAQDALRFSLAGEEAARARTQALQDQAYNLRLGNARFAADAAVNVEANDNVTLTQSGGQGDVIFRPQADAHVFWPLTAKNAITFSLGLGYVSYLNQSQYNYLLVTPGSELSFDLFVKDLRFTFFDRFSYSEDPLQNGAVSGVARYGGFENATGLNVLWDLDKVILTAGYAHQIFITDQQQFEYLNRASELFNARAAYLLTSTLAVGPEVSSGLTSYDLSYLSDAVSFSGGAFIEVKVSPHLSANAHAGYVSYDFQSQGPISAGSSPSTYYFSVGLDQTVNQYLAHSLQAGREVTLGTYSNFQDLYYTRYSMNWNIIRNVSLNTQFFYEHATYPPVVVTLPNIPAIYLFGDTYDRFGVAIDVGYRLMKKLTARIGYRLTLKDSGTQTLSYTQNAVTLGLNYQF